VQLGDDFQISVVSLELKSCECQCVMMVQYIGGCEWDNAKIAEGFRSNHK